MAEFLGEGRGRQLGVKPSQKAAVAPVHSAGDLTAPKARNRKPESAKENGFKRLIHDFKGGLAVLGEAIERLVRQVPQSVELKQPIKHDTVERERVRTLTVPKILERELKTVQSIVERNPSKYTQHTMKEYAAQARSAIASGLPQLMAGIVRASSNLPEALRPARGNAVEALMQVAKASQAGRLPFVPVETRKKAQELLNSIYGRQSGRPATWRDKELTRIIEQQRLIPIAVQSTIAAKQSSQMVMPQARNDVVINQPMHERSRGDDITNVSNVSLRTPLSEIEANKLEAVLPRFRDEGVGSGPKIIDAGESVAHMDGSTVVYRDNSPHVAGSETPTSKPSDPSMTRAEGASPASPEHKSAGAKTEAGTEQGSRIHGGLGSTAGGGTAGASGGPMKISGELTIAGLANWIAHIEGTMRNG